MLWGDLKALIYCTNLLHLFSETPFRFIKNVSTIVAIIVLIVGDVAGGAGGQRSTPSVCSGSLQESLDYIFKIYTSIFIYM